MVVSLSWRLGLLFYVVNRSNCCTGPGPCLLPSRQLFKHFIRRAPSTPPVYSALVVLGDSYSDDEHRATEPLSNPYAALGNKSRGILWPNVLAEKLSQTQSVGLFDYAYNGAHASSDLTTLNNASVPDTRNQLNEFTSQLDKGEISLGEQQTLVVWWVGINPIDAIWIEACGPQANNQTGAQLPTEPLFINALDRVDKEITEVRTQLVRASSILVARRRTATDYMLVTIPHLDSATLQQDLIKQWSKGDMSVGNDYRKLLLNLTDRYNEGLRGLVKNTELYQPNENKGTLKLYDVIPIWNSIMNNGPKYGITNTTGRCFADNVVCPDPEKFFYWDYIHLGPKVERIIAEDMYNRISTL